MVGRSQAGAVNENGDGLAVTEPTISELDEENRLLKEELRIEMSGKLKSQKECAFIKGLASRLKEENDELLKRLKESAGDKKEMLELKKKNCELQCAKLRAETEVDFCNGRYNALLEKVAGLEKDSDMLDKLEKIGEAVNMGIESDALVNLPPDTSAGMIKESQEVKSGVEAGKLDCDDKVLSGTNPNGKSLGNSNYVEIDKDAVAELALGTNAGKEKVSEEVESRLEYGMPGSNEKLLSETNTNSSDSSSHRKMPDNNRPLSKEIVEILDSDDEAASREDTRGTVTEGHVDKTHSGKNIVENDPAVHKRALASSLEVGDRCPRIESSKRLKIQDSVPFISHMEPHLYSALNLETRCSGEVDASTKLSKILSELGDDSSSSSGSDDDVDLSVDYSTFIRTDDSAYETRD